MSTVVRRSAYFHSDLRSIILCYASVSNMKCSSKKNATVPLARNRVHPFLYRQKRIQKSSGRCLLEWSASCQNKQPPAELGANRSVEQSSAG